MSPAQSCLQHSFTLLRVHRPSRLRHSGSFCSFCLWSGSASHTCSSQASPQLVFPPFAASDLLSSSTNVPCCECLLAAKSCRQLCPCGVPGGASGAQPGCFSICSSLLPALPAPNTAVLVTHTSGAVGKLPGKKSCCWCAWHCCQAKSARHSLLLGGRGRPVQKAAFHLLIASCLPAV